MDKFIATNNKDKGAKIEIESSKNINDKLIKFCKIVAKKLYLPFMSDFKVKDINQADFGRKEISLAETEMPGLMALRKEYKDKQPLKGARIVRLSSYDNSNSSIN